MIPIKTDKSQSVFGADLPYYYIRDNNGDAIVTEWKASWVERLLFLFKGVMTVRCYSPTQPMILLRVDE